LILDIDGVLYHAGAANFLARAEALHEFRRRGYPFRLLTNITRRSRATLALHLQAYGPAWRPATS